MLEFVVMEMKKREVSIFQVVVGEELKPAIKFYEKNNFTFVKNTVIHGKDVSRVYLFTIK